MKKYLSFSGKAMRSEYWGVTLFNFVALLVTISIGSLLCMAGSGGVALGVTVIVVSCILCSWAGYAVIARRCRDAGISPWFTLTVLIPYIGIIPLIVFGCLSTAKSDE